MDYVSGHNPMGPWAFPIPVTLTWSLPPLYLLQEGYNGPEIRKTMKEARTEEKIVRKLGLKQQNGRRAEV